MLISPKHGFRDPQNVPLCGKLSIAAYIQIHYTQVLGTK